MQEGVGRDLNDNPLALALDRQPLDPPDRRVRLALGGTEGAEVEVTAQVGCRLGHALVIQGPIDPRGAFHSES